jgi:hypothetical protein
MDWQQWHTRYEHSPRLQARLALVQQHLALAIDSCTHPTVQMISICAGDGRDVIPTVRDHPRGRSCSAFLLEAHPALVAAGTRAIIAAGLTEHVRFVQVDATYSTPYLPLIPAAIVLVCGVFGNMLREQIPSFVQHLPALCQQDGTVIWTRHSHDPATDPAIHQLQSAFAAAGFRAQHEAATAPAGFLVASYRSTRTPHPLADNRKLFDFVDYDQAASA